MKTMQLKLTVNGALQEWTIGNGDLLLDVLRQHGYYGVKRGCEHGDCASCTVLLNGLPVNSCQVFAAQLQGAEVVTIEGVAQADRLDPLQEAFLELGAVQCGYCSPGMILTARWLLQENEDPTEPEIRQALSGNLCRCTGYKKIVEAVLLAAERKRAEVLQS